MKALIDQVLTDIGYRENPYLVALADGSMSKEDFLETQIQFYAAVTFFSRPMAAVAAKIPSARLRLGILRNVWEEHGEGSLESAHGETFLALLDALGGVKPADIARRPLWPEVRMFNTTLTGACVMDEYLVGVSVLGIIERMFADISSWIGQGIIARGWLERERVVHYSVHEVLDHQHADDFFAVLAPAWDASADDRYYIEQGLRLGAHAFDTLYRGLYRARGRRWTRERALPHLRT